MAEWWSGGGRGRGQLVAGGAWSFLEVGVRVECKTTVVEYDTEILKCIGPNR